MNGLEQGGVLGDVVDSVNAEQRKAGRGGRFVDGRRLRLVKRSRAKLELNIEQLQMLLRVASEFQRCLIG